MATTDSAETGFSTDLPPEIAAEERRAAAGTGPWRIAMRRLRRNKVALAFGALFLVLVAISLAAPLYAKHVAKTTPYKNNITGTVNVDGKQENVVALDGVPIGPTWHGQYFLGADRNGRDVMVRLLYGGRNSLLIGIGASIITLIFATIFGLIAGFFGGWTDAIISRVLRHHVGVPGDPAGHRARRVAEPRRHQSRADPSGGRLAVDPDDHHRGLLHRRTSRGRSAAR